MKSSTAHHIYFCTTHPLRTRIFVPILLLSLLRKLLQLVVLLLSLRVLLQIRQIILIPNRTLPRHRNTLLHCGTVTNALPPLLQVGKVAELHAGEVGDVDPAVVGDVGDAELLAHEIGARGEVGVEDAVKALGFAYVALGGVGDAFFGETVEAVISKLGSYTLCSERCRYGIYSLVRLSLHRAQATYTTVRSTRISLIQHHVICVPCCHATHCSHSESSGSLVKANLCSGSYTLVK